MAFIPVPNTAQVELVFMQHGSLVENTLWLEGAAPMTLENLEDIADLVAGWWNSYMSGLLSVDLTLVKVKVTAMDSVTAPMFETAITSDNQGTVNSSSQANNVTWAIKFTTALRGRSFRGRNYIAGIPGNAISENEVSGTFANDIVDAYQAFATALIPFTWGHVVVSRFTAGAPRSTGVTTPVVAYSYSDLTVDSQNRRLPGRGT